MKAACPITFSSCFPLQAPCLSNWDMASLTRHTLFGTGWIAVPRSCQPNTLMPSPSTKLLSSSWTIRPRSRSRATPFSAKSFTCSALVPNTTKLSTYSRCIHSPAGTAERSSSRLWAFAPISLTTCWWIVWRHHNAWDHPMGKTFRRG